MYSFIPIFVTLKSVSSSYVFQSGGQVWEHADWQKKHSSMSLCTPPSDHPPGRCLAHPHLLDADQPEATRRHVVGPLASSTHEDPSLRESSEQDQRHENEPNVHS